jgi:hypothetical protein
MRVKINHIFNEPFFTVSTFELCSYNIQIQLQIYFSAAWFGKIIIFISSFHTEISSKFFSFQCLFISSRTINFFICYFSLWFCRRCYLYSHNSLWFYLPLIWNFILIVFSLFFFSTLVSWLKFDFVLVGFDLWVSCSYFNDLLRIISTECSSNSRLIACVVFWYTLWFINELLKISFDYMCSFLI